MEKWEFGIMMTCLDIENVCSSVISMSKSHVGLILNNKRVIIWTKKTKVMILFEPITRIREWPYMCLTDIKLIH